MFAFVLRFFSTISRSSPSAMWNPQHGVFSPPVRNYYYYIHPSEWTSKWLRLSSPQKYNAMEVINIFCDNFVYWLFFERDTSKEHQIGGWTILWNISFNKELNVYDISAYYVHNVGMSSSKTLHGMLHEIGASVWFGTRKHKVLEFVVVEFLREIIFGYIWLL